VTCQKYAALLVKDARADASQHDQLVPDSAAQPGEVGRQRNVLIIFLGGRVRPKEPLPVTPLSADVPRFSTVTRL
jgi:hypothetical protein